ncbi:unnamed protein product [Boreogadus saida]
MNCSLMPHGLKVARLAEVEGPQVEGELPPPGREPVVRVRSPPRAALPRKKARKADGYSAKVDKLVSEFAVIKSLLFNLQPVRLASTQGSIPQAEAPTTPEWDGDSLSMRASCSQFYEGRPGQGEVEASTQASEDGSQHVWLAQSPLSEPCRRTLRTLPVVPGELFGSAAQQALDRGIQAKQPPAHPSGYHQLLSDLIKPVGLPQGQYPRHRGVEGRGFPPPRPPRRRGGWY